LASDDLWWLWGGTLPTPDHDTAKIAEGEISAALPPTDGSNIILRASALSDQRDANAPSKSAHDATTKGWRPRASKSRPR
jgi:hypothetical protein